MTISYLKVPFIQQFKKKRSTILKLSFLKRNNNIDSVEIIVDCRHVSIHLGQSNRRTSNQVVGDPCHGGLPRCFEFSAGSSISGERFAQNSDQPWMSPFRHLPNRRFAVINLILGRSLQKGLPFSIAK